MIHASLILNNVGKPRLVKIYDPQSSPSPSELTSRIFDLIALRPDSICNFVELPGGLSSLIEGKGKVRETATTSKPLRVCYRRFATLYFVFVIDENESELGILDLIQVFVEALDRCFAEVCELDLIFAFDRVHTLLSCMIIGGLVMDTSVESIAINFKAAEREAKKSESAGSLAAELSLGSAGARIQSGLSAFRGRA